MAFTLNGKVGSKCITTLYDRSIKMDLGHVNAVHMSNFEGRSLKGKIILVISNLGLNLLSSYGVDYKDEK